MAFDRDERRLVRVHEQRVSDGTRRGFWDQAVVEIYDIEPFTRPSWLGSLLRDWFGPDSVGPDGSFTLTREESGFFRSAVFGEDSGEIVLDLGRMGLQARNEDGDVLSRSGERDAVPRPLVCGRSGARLIEANRASVMRELEARFLAHTDGCEFGRSEHEVVMRHDGGVSAFDIGVDD